MAVCEQGQINQFHCQQPPPHMAMTWPEFEANLASFEEFEAIGEPVETTEVSFILYRNSVKLARAIVYTCLIS